MSCVITLCYLYARKDYVMEREAKSGKGYCDYLFLPQKTGKPAITLELSSQIKEKNYMEKARRYTQDILLVGISYNRVEKNITV